MEIQKKTATSGESSNGPVAKDDRYAVFQFADKVTGEPVYSVEEKLAGGEKRYIRVRGQMHGNQIPGEDILKMLHGQPCKLKGVRKSDSRPFTVEASIRRVRTGEGDDGKTYHNADIGIASYRINGENEVFGYSIKVKVDEKDARVRFLKEARIDEENVASLNSGELWKLWDAGVGTPVNLGGGVEATLVGLEDKSEPEDAMKTYYASVRARQISIDAEESVSGEDAAEEDDHFEPEEAERSGVSVG